MEPYSTYHNNVVEPAMFGAAIAQRVREEADAIAMAAGSELGLPVSFVHAQLDYVVRCLQPLAGRAVPHPARPEATFLFPSNTEGAMPIYILALTTSLGVKAHAKLSQRCAGLQACLERVFDGVAGVRFYSGSGQSFLWRMLEEPGVRFLQVFGDDAWIHGYEEPVRTSGKTLAFDGPGKDPVIVLEGADLDRAVQGTVASGLFAGGAACMSPERFLVHEYLLEPYLDRLAEQLAQLKPRPPDHCEAILGYLYSGRAAGRLQEQIADAIESGAQTVLDGRVKPVEFMGRPFYACDPVVLRDVPPGSRILTEETFGPVFPVQSFRSPAEAAAIAEDCPYGLTATVFGPDAMAHTVAHRLRSSHAIVYVNETMLEGFRPEYWGSGGYKRSGWVWETGCDGVFRTRHGYRPLWKELSKILTPGKEREP